MSVVLFVMTGLTSSASPIIHWWLTPLHTIDGDISSANEGVAQHGTAWQAHSVRAIKQ